MKHLLAGTWPVECFPAQCSHVKCSLTFPFQSYHGRQEHTASIPHAIVVKTLKLCGIIATSTHDERPRNRTELSVRIVFHVTLTSVDSYRCDSHCLAQLFENLPAPPKYYGIFDVLPICKVFAKVENLQSH